MPKDIHNAEQLNQVAKLKIGDEQRMRFRIEECVNPIDAKYGEKVRPLVKDCLSVAAEWRANVDVQCALLETLAEYGHVTNEQVREMDEARKKIDPLNISLLEDEVTQHDQLAVLAEIGRYVSPETAAILHPGTTSYDIVDTSRAMLFKKAWKSYLKPECEKLIAKFMKLSEEYTDTVQIGRTHLQYTSPILFGGYLSSIAVRLARGYKKLDEAFNGLKGKISGIVGTGSGVDQFVGEGNDMEFERKVLDKLGLEPELCMGQTTSKETYMVVGESLSNYMEVLGKFANDIRILYSSDIKEVVSRKVRTGGSSTDAFKDNPINWENIAATRKILLGELVTLNALLDTDLQRDLRDSKIGRYEPQNMMANLYESLLRANKAMDSISVNQDMMKLHLGHFEKTPSEAMVTILKSHGFKTDIYETSHDFVKNLSGDVKLGKGTLLELAMKNETFKGVYDNKLSERQKKTLQGDYNQYLGSSKQRTYMNLKEVKQILAGA